MDTTSTPDPIADLAWNALGAKLGIDIAIDLREYADEIGMDPWNSGMGWLLMGIITNKQREVL